MSKREITFKGTVIEYSGSDTKVERINCTERIEEELILQVANRNIVLSVSVHSNVLWFLVDCFSVLVFLPFPSVIFVDQRPEFNLWL